MTLRVLTTPIDSFESTPNPKIAPIVVGGAMFVGKAIVGGAIGTAASWGLLLVA